MNTLTPFEALIACIDAAGSQSALARDLDCSPTAIWKMVQVHRMSVNYVITAERLYGVSRHDLRPDIYESKSAFDIDPRRHQMRDQGGPNRFFGVDQYPNIQDAA